MNLIPTAVTAWRDERSIDDAIRHHDRAGLAKAIALGLTFLLTVLRGTKYGQLVAFADPDMLTAAGLLVAGAVAAFGHWADGGALAAAAAPPAAAAVAAAGPASSVASKPAPALVQRPPDALSRQDADALRNGG